jgi:hypothetical protein
MEVYASGDPLSGAAAARRALEAALGECERRLHPAHALVFVLLQPLANVCGATGDQRAKLAHCERAVALVDAALPPLHLAAAQYHAALAAAIAQLAQARALPQQRLRELARRRDAALQRNLQICTAACGDAHPLTAHARALVSAAPRLGAPR